MAEQVTGILDRLQPEAAYFGPLGGRRTTMVLVLRMRDSSEVPRWVSRKGLAAVR